MARSRQRRRQKEPTLYRPALDDVRASFQRGMKSDVELLTIIANHAQMYVDGDQVGAFTERERTHLATAVQEIQLAAKRLKVVSRRKRG